MKETKVKVWAGVIALTFASMPQTAAATATLSLVYGPINNPGSLIQASDGNFYGVARNTNFYYPSTVFKVTPDGHFKTLFSAPYIPSGTVHYPVGGEFQNRPEFRDFLRF